MEQQVVMVTGAGGNLGQAVIKELSSQGGCLICLERNPKALATFMGSLPSETEVFDRLWSRGLARKDANVDIWMKDVAPSRNLRRWFVADRIPPAQRPTKREATC
jgi:short-subunit dehydrogenase